MNYRRFRSFRLLLLVLSLGALACDAGDVMALFGGANKPSVAITSPPSGSQYHEGEDVAVQSVSTDANGVLRVELVVDGQIIRSDTVPSPQTQFALIQTWKATQGSHTILVRAYNTQSVSSDPAAISIQVSPATAGGPGTLPVLPTSTTAPGGPSPTTGTAGCTNNSAFVADVAVPDGTNMTAGQAFTKIWRLSNSGTCTWGAGYQFVFVSGDAMTSSTVIAAPNTAPGATADLSVGMTAPASPGTYTGQWRMRSPGGANFGQTVSVKISVPGPGAPPPPTNTSAPSCPGPPVISSFTASPNPITAGASTTLSWGGVSNATSASIDQGIGGIATPGSTSVSPPSTTTYTLTATGCGGTATSQVTVTVNPAAIPVPTQQTPASGAVFRIFPRVASFNWSDVSYPGGVKYNIEIQINTGSWQAFAIANNLTSSNYTMSAFTGDNPGRWRVWATSPTAGDGPKSGWWDFSFNTSAAQYDGTWLNDNSSTSGITKVIISNSGQTLYVHPYGKCSPTDCDWGTRFGTFNGEPFVITFSGPPVSQLTITLNNAAGTQLKVVEVSTGTFTYTFHK